MGWHHPTAHSINTHGSSLPQNPFKKQTGLVATNIVLLKITRYATGARRTHLFSDQT